MTVVCLAAEVTGDAVAGVAGAGAAMAAVTVTSVLESPTFSEMDCAGSAGAIDSASTDIYNNVTVMVCKIRRGEYYNTRVGFNMIS